MDVYPRSSITLEKIAFTNYVGGELDMIKREQSVGHRAPVSPREVICPQPRRIVRTGFIFDSLDKLCCTNKSNLPAIHNKQSSLDIISRLLSKDDVEDDLDNSRVQIGLFCGSPPVRTNNPLIHDVQFVCQAPALASPMETVHGAKGSSARVERVSSCGTSTFGGNPLVRIEGFSCGGSKSHCIVPALA